MEQVAQVPAPSPEPAPQAEPDPPPPLPRTAVLDDAIRAARTTAQLRILPRNQEPFPDLPPLPDGPLPGADVPPEAIPGFFAPLHYPPDHDPLASFEAALAELEAGTRDTPVRLAFYGASGTASDLWTGYVRAYLQARFGNGGPGLVAAAKPNRWYRHTEFQLEVPKKRWTRNNSYRRVDDEDPGHFGAMGQSVTADSKRAWSEIKPGKRSTTADQIAFYELHHLQQPRGGSYVVRIDGKVAAEVSTRLPKGEDRPRLGTHRVDVESGEHTVRIELAGDGEVRLLGMVAETEKPGIVLDTLGVDGAKTSNQLLWDEPLWTEHIRSRDPVLYVLAFGSNESVDEDEPISQYESENRRVLERFRRVLPDASCVMFGPGDFPKIDEEGMPQPRPRLDEIREVQRRLAPEYGCAFFDALQMVGGHGAKSAWVNAGLAREDYLHLTRRGYVRLAMGFADALMHRYDWKASRE